MGKKQQEITITLREFKAWLQGVEELQPKDWHPDGAQWKLIRKKINNIVEVEYPANQTGIVRNNSPAQGLFPSRLPPPAPIVPSAIPATALDLSEAQQRAIGPAVKQVDGKIVTPNIDTSNGEYNSSFV